MSLAGLKDDLIKSFHEQMFSRDQQVAEITAELNACYARLEESDSLLERCFLFAFLRFDSDHHHSACATLQDNVKLAQEEAVKVAPSLPLPSPFGHL